MIHLGTLVLSANGSDMAPVGAFIHPPDAPPWRWTLDGEGQPAEIKGATVVDAEDLGQQALCLVVTSREKAPLIGSEGTKVYSLDREEWVTISRVGVGESIRVPELSKAGTVVSWGKVKQVARAPLPERLLLDANKMWGRLVLFRGYFSFASAACFVKER